MQRLSAQQYDFLRRQLDEYVRDELMTSDARDEALSRYTVQRTASPLTILLAIGAILIGIGVLVAVSTNWAHFSTMGKLLILFGSTGIAYVIAYQTQHSFPTTSRACYYVAALLVGTSLYFIQRLYNGNAPVGTLALLWAISLIPLVYFLKDRVLATLFGIALFSASVSYATNFSYGIFLIFFLIGLLFWLNETQLRESLLIFTITIVISTVWIASMMSSIDVDPLVSISLIFIFGIALLFNSFETYALLARWLGTIIVSITILLLMSESTWTVISTSYASFISIAVTVTFTLFAFAMLRWMPLHAIVFIGIAIARIFFDYTFEVIPKSIFFIGIGLLILTFGFWFERTRQKEGDVS